MGKRLENLKKKIDLEKVYSYKEGVELIKKASTARFDETIEVHIKLGINPKHSDQQVRGTVVLPHGSGKTKKVAVIAKGEKVSEAQKAGADVCGGTELISEILAGKINFDVLTVTPDMMKDVAKLGKILGPKGLMPNPKSGTVTFEIERTVKELKAGRVEFKSDSQGIVHVPVGRSSFPTENLVDNIKALVEAVVRNKPQASKGSYFQSIYITSTMGPGIKLNSEKNM